MNGHEYHLLLLRIQRAIVSYFLSTWASAELSLIPCHLSVALQRCKTLRSSHLFAFMNRILGYKGFQSIFKAILLLSIQMSAIFPVTGRVPAIFPTNSLWVKSETFNANVITRRLAGIKKEKVKNTSCFIELLKAWNYLRLYKASFRWFSAQTCSIFARLSCSITERRQSGGAEWWEKVDCRKDQIKRKDFCQLFARFNTSFRRGLFEGYVCRSGHGR